jgi:predicted small integral membrane protein
MWEMNAYRILAGKSEGKRTLGRPRHRWEDKFIMDLMGVGWCDVSWIDLAPDRDRWRALVNTVINFLVP